LKGQTLIKTVGAGIVGEWIGENSRHQRVSKTLSQGKLHQENI
jgi:hypothetical protein